MKQEAKGKIFVGMIVSIVAFGFATGTGFFMGANPINTNGILNLTQQSQFPSIPASQTTNPTVKTTNQTTVPSGQSGQTNTVTPSNPSSGNNSNKPSNNNQSGNSSGN
ncbi:MAG: hypothetical protein NKF70_01645 [Methanobacterium sp. ERen5]|jgi:hypothetical protein|nr:MAG: hypothetical protein NKF70_01645 [Methanobacterium sp. ERen5]